MFNILLAVFPRDSPKTWELETLEFFSLNLEVCVDFFGCKMYLFPDCGSSGPVSSCDIKLGRPVEGCDWKAFLSYGDPNTTNIVEELAENCDLKGFCR